MALSADFTWKLGDTGTELNTEALNVPFVDVQRVYGWDSAPIRETERDHEGTDGGFMDAEFEKGRPLMLDGIAYGDPFALEAYLDQLKYEWAPRTSPVPLYFKIPGVAERLFFVKPRGMRYDMTNERRYGAAHCQFVAYAEDPRAYDSALSTAVIPFGGTGGPGFAFSFGFNLNFGGGTTPAGAFVNNTGNRPAPAILTVQGPIDYPIIANDTTGDVLNFNLFGMGASNLLVIDLGNRTVLYDGVTNFRSTLTTPNWFLLQPGPNFIRFGGTNGTGSTLTVSFRSAWR